MSKKSQKLSFNQTVRKILKGVDGSRSMSPQCATLMSNLSHEILEQMRDDCVFISARSNKHAFNTERCTEMILARIPVEIRRKLTRHNKSVIKDYDAELEQKKRDHADKMQAMSADELKEHKEKYNKQFGRVKAA